MPKKTYALVNKSTKMVENVVAMDQNNLLGFQETIPDYEMVVDPENTTYFGVGREYVNGYFQPVEAEGENWTKNSDGVWNEIVNKPEGMDWYWLSENNEWTDDPTLVVDPG